MFWGPRSCHSALEKQICICFVKSISQTTPGEKNPRPTVPRASGIGISRREKTRCFDPVTLHIVVSLSNLLENFPLALGSFSNWSAVFQRLLCMVKDKGLFIKQNGEALASRKGGWMLWPPVLAPPCTSLQSPLWALPTPRGGRTTWTPLLGLEVEHYCKLSRP